MTRAGQRWLVLASLALLAGGALALRAGIARHMEHPGHADDAFYFVVARNLAQGRGLEIDYIWHYLDPPRRITHPASDYWLPLPSVVMGAALRLFGASVAVALWPGMIAGVAIAGVVYLWVRALDSSPLPALGAFAVALVEPGLFTASLTTNSTIYYALFVTLTLFLAFRGPRNPRLFAWGGATAGLASLTRQDGVLLLAPLLLAVAWSSRRPRAALLRMAGALAAYAVVLAPLLILNYRAFGAPWAAGRSKLLFVTRFEDLYSYANRPSLSTYLDWGAANIALSKIGATLVNLESLVDLFGWLGAVALGGALVALARPRDAGGRQACAPALVFLGLLFAFHTLVTTFTAGTGFLNSAPAALPFLIVFAVEAVRRWTRWPVVALVLAGLATTHFAYRSVAEARGMVAARHAMVEPLGALRALVDQDHRGSAAEAVIMTRVPWEVNYSTGYRAIQIPNDDLPTILAVARRYGANYLLLPAPRPALEPVYRQERADGRFPFVGAIPHASGDLGQYSPLKLFRIDLAGAARP